MQSCWAEDSEYSMMIQYCLGLPGKIKSKCKNLELKGFLSHTYDQHLVFCLVWVHKTKHLRLITTRSKRPFLLLGQNHMYVTRGAYNQYVVITYSLL